MKAPQSRKPYTKVAADVSGLFQKAKASRTICDAHHLNHPPKLGGVFWASGAYLQSMGVNRDHAAVTKLGRFHEGYEGRR